MNPSDFNRTIFGSIGKIIAFVSLLLKIHKNI